MSILQIYPSASSLLKVFVLLKYDSQVIVAYRLSTMAIISLRERPVVVFCDKKPKQHIIFICGDQAPSALVLQPIQFEWKYFVLLQRRSGGHFDTHGLGGRHMVGPTKDVYIFRSRSDNGPHRFNPYHHGNTNGYCGKRAPQFPYRLASSSIYFVAAPQAPLNIPHGGLLPVKCKRYKYTDHIFPSATVIIFKRGSK